MKFRSIIAAALSVATFYSCTTSPIPEESINGSQTEITAVIPDSEVRTSLGNESNNARKVMWEKGDCVALFDDTKFGRVMTLTSDAGSNTGIFSGLASANFETKNYYAVYPASAAKASTATGIDVLLPSAHTRIDGGGSPMVGLTTNTGSIDFLALCGMLELRITGLSTLESVTVTSKTMPLSGVAHVAINNGTPTATVEGEKNVTVTPTSSIKLSDSAKSIFITIPAANYPAGDLVIKIKASGEEYEFTSSKAHNIQRSHIKPITGLKAEVEPEYIDLTANNSYANCFVVSKEGWYSFEARTRGGYATVVHPKTGAALASLGGNKAKACLAWESSAEMISRVEYNVSNRKITFFYSGTEGNAMICLVDENNAVQWSWHIWATDTPQEQKIGSNVYLDRNVGAWAAPKDAVDGWNYMHRQWDNAKAAYPTVGLLYQWGRPVPFPSGGHAHLRNSGTYQRESYTIVFADFGCESLATQSDDARYGDTPPYNCPSSSILSSVYTDKSAVAVSGTWNNKWWYQNHTTNVDFATAIRHPMTVYGTAAANEPKALKDVIKQNFYVEDCAPRKFWCNDLFSGSFDFASTYSPWNYAVRDNIKYDVCPYGYRVADGNAAINDFKSLGLKWRYQKYDGSNQTEGAVPAGQTICTGAAYATAADGSFVWVPTSGARVFYGAYADQNVINWWGASNNNKVTAIQFAADAKLSASVVVKDGYYDEGPGTYTYNGTNYPITDQNKIEETSISLALAVRCVKDTTATGDGTSSQIPTEDMDQIVDDNEW